MRTVVERKDMLRIPQPARKVNKPLKDWGEGELRVGLPTLFWTEASKEISRKRHRASRGG